MNRWTKVLFAAPSLLIVLIAFAGSELKPYRYGDIEANVPTGWKSSVNYAPGVRLMVASGNPDQPETTPELFRLEATPLITMEPKARSANRTRYPKLRVTLNIWRDST